MTDSDREFVRELVRRNRYLTLSTTDGDSPWIAPLEYISDEDLNLYFFSPESTTHARHISLRQNVALTIFDARQPDYEPAPMIRLAGVQIMATARKMNAPYPDLVQKQAETWKLPIPPYAAYKIVPERWFLPVVRDGINERIEVSMG